MPIGKKLFSLKLKRKITDKGVDDTIESDKRLRHVNSNLLPENETNSSRQENVSSATIITNPFNQEYKNRVPLPCYCGLINNANNCYISCVIQALRISAHFVGVVDAVYHLLSKDQIILEMQTKEQIKDIKSITAIRLDQFMESIWSNSDSFLPNSQHDAHEFLHFILKYLEDGCELTGDQTLQNDFARIFKGTLLFRTRCLECENVREKAESFHDISLSLDSTTNTDPVKLSSLLKKFTAVDYLDGINKYYCEHCRNYTEAEIGVVFDNIPKILIFHLKRLTTFDSYGYNKKIMTAVATCPELVLDQCTLCSSRCQAKNEKYRLLAIIVHAGVSGSSGHYYSYIRVSNIDVQDHQQDAPISSKADSESLDKNTATADESSSAMLISDLPKYSVIDESVNMSNPEWVLFNDTVVKWVNDEQLLNILEPKGLNSSSTAYILIYSQI